MSGSRVTLNWVSLNSAAPPFPPQCHVWGLCNRGDKSSCHSSVPNDQPTGTPRLPSPAVQRFPAVQREQRAVGGCTYINEIRQVVDVVLEHRGIGGFQGQQILVPCLDCLQSVLCVLCLALEDNKKQNIALKEVSSTLGNTREH